MDPNQTIVCLYRLGSGVRGGQASLARWGGFSAIDHAAMADAHHKNQQPLKDPADPVLDWSEVRDALLAAD